MLTIKNVTSEQRYKRKQFYLRNGYTQTSVRYHWRQL